MNNKQAKKILKKYQKLFWIHAHEGGKNCNMKTYPDMCQGKHNITLEIAIAWQLHNYIYGLTTAGFGENNQLLEDLKEIVFFVSYAINKTGKNMELKQLIKNLKKEMKWKIIF